MTQESFTTVSQRHITSDLAGAFASLSRMASSFIRVKTKQILAPSFISRFYDFLCASVSLWWILVFLPLFLLTACGNKELPTYEEQGYVFGTLVEVSVYGEEDAKARKAVTSVMQEFQRLHDLLHAWKPSALSDLNAAIAKGESREVTPEIAAMLKDAAQLSAQSDGLFNPAIGGLVRLWGFHADEYKAALPDEKQLAALVAAHPQMSDLVFCLLRQAQDRPSPMAKVSWCVAITRPCCSISAATPKAMRWIERRSC